jgi:hypothetical protein
MLIHAAAAVIVGQPTARALRVVSVAVFVSCLLATPVFALDGIDLSKPAEMSGEVDAEAGAPAGCPELVQIKYPFLTCANGQIGQSDADELWENSRRIPVGSAFVEGNGYFGEDLNTYY